MCIYQNVLLVPHRHQDSTIATQVLHGTSKLTPSNCSLCRTCWPTLSTRQGNHSTWYQSSQTCTGYQSLLGLNKNSSHDLQSSHHRTATLSTICYSCTDQPNNSGSVSTTISTSTTHLLQLPSLFCLGFNGTFSTNRLHRAITVGYYIM